MNQTSIAKLFATSYKVRSTIRNLLPWTAKPSLLKHDPNGF